MTKFRKKPVIIDAWQFTDVTEAPKWLYNSEVTKVAVYFDHIQIHTLEGNMIAIKGDWIIKGVNGELYPCKDDIFQKTYEKVEE